MANKKNRIYLEYEKLPYEIEKENAIWSKKYRKPLEAYLGKDTHFEGCLMHIIPERVLIKDLYITVDDECALSDRIGHVYVYPGLTFLSFKEKDIISFNAVPYAYKREDGTCDIALKNADGTKKIDVSRSNGEDIAMEISKQICKRCRYKEVCYGKCCKPSKKEKQIDYILWKREKEGRRPS